MNFANTFLGTPFLQNASGGCSCKSLQLFRHSRIFVKFLKLFGMYFDALLQILLKEEILPHYQDSQFFQTYTNSNKMSGPLHVRINGCILY